MSKESSKKASSSTPSSSSPGDSFIGSFISLTSKCEIRYEGVLYYLNPQDSTLGLKNVRSYGTEGRKKEGPQIPPSEQVYEYILFRGSDIKDLQVKSSPPAQIEEPMHNDPAIIQSHCAVGPSSSSKSVPVGGSALAEYNSNLEPSSLTSRSYPGVFPSHQSGALVSSWVPQAPQNAHLSSFVMSVQGEGHNGASSGAHNAPRQPISAAAATATASAAQNLFQPAVLQMPATSGYLNSFKASTAVPSPTCTSSVHSNVRPYLIPGQYSNPPADMTSTLSLKSSLLSHPAVLTANNITMSSFPSTSQDFNIVEPHIVGKVGSEPASFIPVQSFSYSASSVLDSTSGPLLNQPPILLTPDKLSQPWPSAFSLTHISLTDQKDMGSLSSASSNSSTSIATPAVQAPLLPLPSSAQQSQYSSQFSEEFDFVAMNEKFRKDEVWGYLGKTKQRDKTDGAEDDVVGQDTGNNEGYGLVPKGDSKPAYNKDEFFDTISCNSLARGSGDGQNRFSGRMRLDNETFGTFQQRNYQGYGGYGVGRGEIRSPHNWGRGHNYGGRGRGGYMRR